MLLSCWVVQAGVMEVLYSMYGVYLNEVYVLAPTSGSGPGNQDTTAGQLLKTAGLYRSHMAGAMDKTSVYSRKTPYFVYITTIAC